MASELQGNQLVEYALRVQAPVNVITKRHDGIVGLWINQVEDRRQSGRTTVNVADGDGSTLFVHVEFKSPSLSFGEPLCS